MWQCLRQSRHTAEVDSSSGCQGQFQMPLQSVNVLLQRVDYSIVCMCGNWSHTSLYLSWRCPCHRFDNHDRWRLWCQDLSWGPEVLGLTGRSLFFDRHDELKYILQLWGSNLLVKKVDLDIMYFSVLRLFVYSCILQVSLSLQFATWLYVIWVYNEILSSETGWTF